MISGWLTTGSLIPWVILSFSQEAKTALQATGRVAFPQKEPQKELPEKTLKEGNNLNLKG
jgi:hypothetical protein